jgi:hypothetical protein
MLESAIVRKPGTQSPGDYDVGRLFEALLYYGRVHLILDQTTFPALWSKIGAEGLSELMACDSLTVSLAPEMPAMKNDTLNFETLHLPVYIRYAGQEGAPVSHSDVEGIFLHYVRQRMGENVSRHDVRKVLKRARVTSYSKLMDNEARDHAIFKSLASDPDTLKYLIRRWATAYRRIINDVALDKSRIEIYEKEVPGYPGLIGIGVFCDTPLYNIVQPLNHPLTWGDILANAHEYTIDLYLSSSFSSDLVCNDEVGALAAHRIDRTLERASQTNLAISAFEDVVFSESHFFGGAINRGEVSVSEALNVISKSRKFREWLNGVPPGHDILSEYYRAVAKETILDKLPGSVARFSFFAGAGLGLDVLGAGGAGTSAGLALSAFDGFALNRLVKGWRPNAFVSTVKKIVEKGRKSPS